MLQECCGAWCGVCWIRYQSCRKFRNVLERLVEDMYGWFLIWMMQAEPGAEAELSSRRALFTIWSVCVPEYLCVHACLCIFMCMWVCVSLCASIHTCMCVCVSMLVFACLCGCVCAHVGTSMCVYVCMCRSVCVFACVCRFLCMCGSVCVYCVCLCMCVHACLCMYVCSSSSSTDSSWLGCFSLLCNWCLVLFTTLTANDLW